MKPCKLKAPCRCGSTLGHIVKGKKPHAGRLNCWECGRFVKWLSKTDLKRAIAAKLVDEKGIFC